MLKILHEEFNVLYQCDRIGKKALLLSIQCQQVDSVQYIFDQAPLYWVEECFTESNVDIMAIATCGNIDIIKSLFNKLHIQTLFLYENLLNSIIEQALALGHGEVIKYLYTHVGNVTLYTSNESRICQSLGIPFVEGSKTDVHVDVDVRSINLAVTMPSVAILNDEVEHVMDTHLPQCLNIVPSLWAIGVQDSNITEDMVLSFIDNCVDSGTTTNQNEDAMRSLIWAISHSKTSVMERIQVRYSLEYTRECLIKALATDDIKVLSIILGNSQLSQSIGTWNKVELEGLQADKLITRAKLDTVILVLDHLPSLRKDINICILAQYNNDHHDVFQYVINQFTMDEVDQTINPIIHCAFKLDRLDVLITLDQMYKDHSKSLLIPMVNIFTLVNATQLNSFQTLEYYFKTSDFNNLTKAIRLEVLSAINIKALHAGKVRLLNHTRTLIKAIQANKKRDRDEETNIQQYQYRNVLAPKFLKDLFTCNNDDWKNELDQYLAYTLQRPQDIEINNDLLLLILYPSIVRRLIELGFKITPITTRSYKVNRWIGKPWSLEMIKLLCEVKVLIAPEEFIDIIYQAISRNDVDVARFIVDTKLDELIATDNYMRSRSYAILKACMNSNCPADLADKILSRIPLDSFPRPDEFLMEAARTGNLAMFINVHKLNEREGGHSQRAYAAMEAALKSNNHVDLVNYILQLSQPQGPHDDDFILRYINPKIISIELIERLIDHPCFFCYFDQMLGDAIGAGKRDVIEYLMDNESIFQTDYRYAFQQALKVGQPYLDIIRRILPKFIQHHQDNGQYYKDSFLEFGMMAAKISDDLFIELLQVILQPESTTKKTICCLVEAAAGNSHALVKHVIDMVDSPVFYKMDLSIFISDCVHYLKNAIMACINRDDTDSIECVVTLATKLSSTNDSKPIDPQTLFPLMITNDKLSIFLLEKGYTSNK
ncbi:hypothetical protein SAMD00019534_025320 [Acytostelium subglobosum LB1]|uniref:hypothetical protein n=1 Tax=Acytostelium subglobosum LB1 TaxID=1410327 RepID=UPI000644CC81|nr:hypothetical protein SAMD00019534_025320 [Acytostelium subglobosum LB1]GAM19357.1 hypothetical protein SAMD00019534_025320 [Acytostelium subglobosum LB1]|eukprot:XP_012757284.1 hypothetical protein SAMD00019534_025320 [Acytostelium subglobosum LB1]